MIEIKTTSVEYKMEWIRNKIPIEYTLQVSLYGYLLNVENVMIIVSFLEEEDYQNPEAFQPNEENTKIFHFNIYQQHPDFLEIIQDAKNWWSQYILTGISPRFIDDEKKDHSLLQELKESKVLTLEKIDIQNELQNLEECLVHFERLKKEKLILEYLNLKKKIDLTKENIKKYIQEIKEESKNEYIMKGNNYNFIAKVSTMETINKDLLLKDGLYQKYVQSNERCTIYPKKLEKK